MTQEVQVILTLEVDAEKSKADVRRYILDMESSYRALQYNVSKGFEPITDIQVKQESEIYNNK